MEFKNVLILSPHTDDAELGSGGTISKFIREGKNILWVAFSTAEESLPAHMPKDTLAVEFTNVVKSLGLKDHNFKILNFKVRKLTSNRQDVLDELIKIRKDFKPDLVIGPSLNDFHQDHSVVANEMIRAYKTSSSIICYELPWNHIEFKTQMFVELEKQDVESKLNMMSHYKSQMEIERHYFSRDYIHGIASTRGAQIGEKYAEAFEVVRWRL